MNKQKDLPGQLCFLKRSSSQRCSLGKHFSRTTGGAAASLSISFAAFLVVCVRDNCDELTRNSSPRLIRPRAEQLLRFFFFFFQICFDTKSAWRLWDTEASPRNPTRPPC